MISDKLKKILEQNPGITVLTGAGVSAESGIPTFRDKDGLWSKYNPAELATEEAFRADPALVWGWYQWRRGLIAACEPNDAHRHLAQMEQLNDNFTLITQNVDGLHKRAGSMAMIELHGDIMVSRCIECGTQYEEDLDYSDDTPIECNCGGLMRPGVVWFGESLDESAINSASTASRECDLFISAGTSSIVYPAAAFPQMAKDSGAYLVEINIERTPLSDSADELILSVASAGLSAIMHELERCAA